MLVYKPDLLISCCGPVPVVCREYCLFSKLCFQLQNCLYFTVKQVFFFKLFFFKASYPHNSWRMSHVSKSLTMPNTMLPTVTFAFLFVATLLQITKCQNLTSASTTRIISWLACYLFCQMWVPDEQNAWKYINIVTFNNGLSSAEIKSHTLDKMTPCGQFSR